MSGDHEPGDLRRYVRSFIWLATNWPTTLLLASVVKLVVPIVAMFVKQNDPERNGVYQLFGDAICVQMDFPGWLETNTVFWVVAALLDTVAFYGLYLEVGNGKPVSCYLRLLLSIASLLAMSAILTGFWRSA